MLRVRVGHVPLNAHRIPAVTHPDVAETESAAELGREGGANDGGTARDKAARIANVAVAAEAAGLTPMAVIDGIGWVRRDALVQTLQATHGLTFSLSNLEALVTVPEIVALYGTADD